MHKGLFLTLVATVVALNASALPPGIGLTLTNIGHGIHSSSQDASENTVSVAVTGVVPLGESAEVDPSMGMKYYLSNNPQGVRGLPSDQYSKTYYNAGLSYLLSVPFRPGFRLLAGAGGTVDYGQVSSPGMRGYTKFLDWTIGLPVGLEVAPFPHLGVRLQGSLVSFHEANSYHKINSEVRHETGTLSFGDTFSLSAFYYF